MPPRPTEATEEKVKFEFAAKFFTSSETPTMEGAHGCDFVFLKK